MKVVVASQNPVKLAAARRAFRARFPGAELQLLPLSVSSGVREQPVSDTETRRGARNRVYAARRAVPGADFWVGMEGGLEQMDGRLLASAWMAVADRSGSVSEARTPTLPLPPAVTRLVRGGMELGTANDRVFATLNSKQGGGAFGLLTDGLMTRESVYADTLLLALIPLAHELWQPEPDDP